MKFEVLYTSGVQHEVELQGHTVVVGRDPACDLVLNDAKCSRRHAVLEMGPSGMGVRDNGSANGVFVNGKKVERAPLVPGDVIRIGETVLKILAESTGTVVMGAEEMDDYQETEDLTRPGDLALPPPEPETGPIQAPPPPPRRPTPPVPAASSNASQAPKSRPPMPTPFPRGALPRPMTVTVLAVLWLLAGAVYGAIGLGFAIFGPGGKLAIGVGAVGVILALVSAVVGFGLWARAPWARLLQLTLAGFGLFSCVFTLPSLVIIAYMWRPEIALHFAGPRILSPEEADRARSATPEVAFTVGVVATFMLELVLSLAVLYLSQSYWRKAVGPLGKSEAAPAASPAPAPTPN